MVTLGLGPNVTLVFSPALNVVQVLASLVFVHVVQHCSATKPSKIGYPAQNFARAAFGGAKSSGNKLLETDRMDLICGDDMFRQCSASDVEPFSGQREGFPAKKGNLRGPGGPKGNLGGSRRPSGGLLFKKILNVKLLLFTDPIVVLLLLFSR